MSDLISRSEVVKLLYRYADRKHANGEIELANGILKAKCFIEDVDSVPVAYDLDKVVDKVRESCYEMGFDESQTEVIVNEVKGGVE